MPAQTKLKRKSTSLNEDVLLLEVCLENLDCLHNLENSCYKSLFWKTVTDVLSKCSDYYKNTRQIRDRFKRIYSYYIKIKNTPFFDSKLNSNEKDSHFFKVMDECFSKIYYNKSGILTLIVKNEEPEIQKSKQDWLETFLNGLAPSDDEQLLQRTEMVSYMCEINNEGTYQTAAEMLDQFTYKNTRVEAGFSHELINVNHFTPLNSVFIDDFKII